MLSTRLRRGPATTLAALVLTVGALGACSGGDDDSAGAEGSTDASSETTAGEDTTIDPTAGAEASPYLPVPDGVELTAQGTALEVGDTATVAYQPNQKDVGVLKLTVTDLRKTSYQESFQGWKLDKAIKKSQPYFVRAKVKNVGEDDLGGRRVPLYLVDGDNTLVESSTFVSTFKPCPSQALPKKFGPGAKVTTCLVFLAPAQGSLEAISFRPAQEFNPITWTGEVLKIGEKTAAQKKAAKKAQKKAEKKAEKKSQDKKSTSQD
ncbi:hypothetical protein [Nocardioides dokdonensis]|nr:hypothetical protein [Nocardioides dokdonensis]